MRATSANDERSGVMVFHELLIAASRNLTACPGTHTTSSVTDAIISELNVVFKREHSKLKNPISYDTTCPRARPTKYRLASG